jgi:CelD/BcsL family acetyltransferase involved in cellulose biosynthesis
MYRATMQRLAADDYYFFDEAYFRRLVAAFGDDCWLMRCGLGDRDAAYTLCLRHGEHLHYHLSCSDEAMARAKPVDLLLAETAKLGRKLGLRCFHLGGGYRGADSLFEFKARFSPQRAAFFVGRAIHDDRVVQHLTELARAAGAAPSDTNFFPPYRSRR